MKEQGKKWPEIWPGYETVGKLGRGGYGTVWKVRKVDPSGEYYSAVKKISIPSGEEEYAALSESGYGDDDITSIFQTRLSKIEEEFRLMEEFKGDSHIVSYLEHMIIEHEDEVGWDILIRMELLTPLGKCYDHFSEKEAVKLGMHMCSALETIQRKGIIHRDIKPSNILYNDKLGYYKLADFGIAKTIDHVTKGTMIGTADYIAPEVFNKEAYGLQADQYSLGLVLYWMLNKRKLPFMPIDHIPTDEEMQLAKQKRVNGVQLPAPLHGSNRLRSIVLKACAYDPADRYPDISAMKRDLYSSLDEASKELFNDVDAGNASMPDEAPTPTPVTFDACTQEAPDMPADDDGDDDIGTMGRFGGEKKPGPYDNGTSGGKTETGSSGHGSAYNKNAIDAKQLVDLIERYYALGTEAGDEQARALEAELTNIVENDILEAFFIFGLYSTGHSTVDYNIPKDQDKANRWLFFGAERGDDQCMYFLAKRYYEGTSITKDLDKAKVWVERALSIQPADPDYLKLQAEINNALQSGNPGDDPLKAVNFDDIFNRIFGGVQSGSGSQTVEEILREYLPRLSASESNGELCEVVPNISSVNMDMIFKGWSGPLDKSNGERILKDITNRGEKILGIYRSDFRRIRTGVPLKIVFTNKAFYVNSQNLPPVAIDKNKKSQINFGCYYSLIANAGVKKYPGPSALSVLTCSLVPGSIDFDSFMFYFDEKYTDKDILMEMLLKLSKVN